jgi:hypothetical protein
MNLERKTSMEEKIVYFAKPGRDNTAETIGLALERAAARGVKRIILASTRGSTAREAAEAVKGTGIKLVVVPWQFGFKGREQPFPKELAGELRAQGHEVHFGTMLFHTVDLYGTNIPQAMANILRTFGQGMKVCLEIIMMACDGGAVEIGEKAVVIAGTASGADTAVVATAGPSSKVAALRIHEIICKPLMEK